MQQWYTVFWLHCCQVARMTHFCQMMKHVFVFRSPGASCLPRKETQRGKDIFTLFLIPLPSLCKQATSAFCVCASQFYVSYLVLSCYVPQVISTEALTREF